MKSKLFNIILSIACGLSFATSIVSVSLSAVNNTAPITEEVKTINSTLVDLKALDTTLDGKIVSLETKVTSLEEELTEKREPIINNDEDNGTVHYYHVENYNSLPKIISNGTEHGNDTIDSFDNSH